MFYPTPLSFFMYGVLLSVSVIIQLIIKTVSVINGIHFMGFPCTLKYIEIIMASMICCDRYIP